MGVPQLLIWLFLKLNGAFETRSLQIFILNFNFVTSLCLSWEKDFYYISWEEKCSVKLWRKELEFVSYAPVCMEKLFKKCQQTHEIYSDVSMVRVSSFCLVFFFKDTTEMLKRQSAHSHFVPLGFFNLFFPPLSVDFTKV